MKKFYVVSSFKNKREVQEIIRKLEAIDHVLTYDWTKNSADNMNTEQALLDMQGVIDADYLVGLFNVPDVIYKGAIAEFGMAAILKKPMYIIGNDLDNMVFIHLPNVKKVTSLKEVMELEREIPLPPFNPI